MRFCQLDRITELVPDKRITAVKRLSAGEQYLKDHFPRFPVMPGVLMLQSVAEAASWLWRATTGFQHSVIVLREARQVKYGSFMQPGRKMDVAVEWSKSAGDTVTFKGKGTDDAGQQTVSATLTLAGYNLADLGPAGAAVDAKLVNELKARWAWLTGELK